MRKKDYPVVISGKENVMDAIKKRVARLNEGEFDDAEVTIIYLPKENELAYIEERDTSMINAYALANGNVPIPSVQCYEVVDFDFYIGQSQRAWKKQKEEAVGRAGGKRAIIMLYHVGGGISHGLMLPDEKIVEVKGYKTYRKDYVIRDIATKEVLDKDSCTIHVLPDHERTILGLNASKDCYNRLTRGEAWHPQPPRIIMEDVLCELPPKLRALYQEASLVLNKSYREYIGCEDELFWLEEALYRIDSLVRSGAPREVLQKEEGILDKWLTKIRDKCGHTFMV